MRVEKLVLVLLLVTLLITSSVAAVFVYNSMENGRIVHISVRTDKTYYDAGEKVTFKLIDNNPNIEFNVTDPNNSPQNIMINRVVINIFKIPDDMNLDQVVTDLSNNNQLWEHLQTETGLITVHYDYFSSQETPKSMSWDGMITVHNTLSEDVLYLPATSGHYVIVPNFLGASDHQIKFNIDRGAIFYYNSLNAGINITNNPDNNVTVKLSLGAPPGTNGNLTCELYSNFDYSGSPPSNLTNMTVPNGNHYHNETIVLASGSETTRTLVFDVQIPDDGEPAGGGRSFPGVIFEALLVTPVGNYTFGFNGIWKEGWVEVQQY
jgi:hypothetical protein